MPYREATNKISFLGSFSIENEEDSDFIGQFKIIKGLAAATAGFSLDSIDGVAGWQPFASYNGNAIEAPLDFDPWIKIYGYTLAFHINVDTAPTNVGNVEWVRVKIPYHNESYAFAGRPSGIREVIFYNNDFDWSTIESGVFGRTKIVIDKKIPGRSENYNYVFENIPDGQHAVMVMVKQTFNPQPFIIASGFFVGPERFYIIGASGIPGSGVRPLDINFVTERFDSNPETTEAIHWDFGESQYFGRGKTSENFSYTLNKQGYYNTIVTYVLSDNYTAAIVVSGVKGERKFIYP